MHTNIILGKLLRGIASGDREKAEREIRRDYPYITKAGVGGTEYDDLAGTAASTLNSTFLLSLEQGPAVFDLIRPYTRKASFNTPLFIGGAMTAQITGESIAIPTTKYSVNQSGLSPVKAAGISVITNEALQSREGSESLIEELKQAVALAVDEHFLDSLISTIGSDAIEASSDPLADFKSLFDLVSLTGFGKLVLVMSPSAANFLTCYSSGGQLVFPQMSPKGGICLGVDTMVSGALTDSALLIDPSGLITGADSMEIRISQSAMLEADSDPQGHAEEPTAASANLMSMFQVECSAVLGIRSFAFQLMRESSVACLENVSAWEAS